MGRLITKAGGGDGESVLIYNKTTGTWGDPRPEIGKPLVLISNWAEESWVSDSGFSEAAADAIFASLVQLNKELEGRLFESPLHFIGHSRGTVVNSEIIQRLGTYFPEVNRIHMTTLDPHDFEQPSLDVPLATLVQLAGLLVGEPVFGALLATALNITGFDTFHYADFHDPNVIRWENIAFFDNYYQIVANPTSFTFTPNGRSIMGADIERRLDGRAGFTYDDRIGGTHGRVTNWYAGTTNLAMREFGGDLIYRMIVDQDYSRFLRVDYNDVPWYLAFEGRDPAPFNYMDPDAIWEGIGEGCFWSLLGGGYPSWAAHGTPVYEDNTEFDGPKTPQRTEAVPSVFNGDFESGTLYDIEGYSRFPLSDDIPGWSFHGGSFASANPISGGTHSLANIDGNHAIKLDYYASKATHNRLYVPSDGTYVRFDIQVTNASESGSIEVFIDTVVGGHFSLGTLGIPAKTTGFETKAFELPSELDNVVGTLSFDLKGAGLLNGSVLLDNIAFGPPVIDIDTDSNNDGQIDASDDPIEMQEPGRFVGVNKDYDRQPVVMDQEGRPLRDCDYPIGQSRPLGEDDDLVLVKLNVPNISDWNGYTAVINATTLGGLMRLWEVKENEMHPIAPGTVFVLGDTPNLPSEVYVEGLQPGSVVLTLLVESPDGKTRLEDEIRLRFVEPSIRQVEFATAHTIVQDNGTPYSTETAYWRDGNHDKNADGDFDNTGDLKFPLAYTAGDRMEVRSLVFVFDTSIQKSGAKVRGRAEGLPSTFQTEFRGTTDFNIGGDVAIVTGASLGDPCAIAEDSLPKTILFYNPLRIYWEISLDNGNSWIPAGTTENRLYATLKDPIATKNYETLFDIGARNASGTNNATDAVKEIWAEFTTNLGDGVKRKALDGYNKIDGRSMGYWIGWYQISASNLTLSDMLDKSKDVRADPDGPWYGNGSCLAWAQLFDGVLKAMGIDDSQIYQVIPDTSVNPHASLFLIKEWVFQPEPLPDQPYQNDVFSYFYKEIHRQPTQNSNAFPGTRVATQVSTSSPFSFANHYVVKYGGRWYDPPYGKDFASETEHENATLAGLCGEYYWSDPITFFMRVKPDDDQVRELKYTTDLTSPIPPSPLVGESAGASLLVPLPLFTSGYLGQFVQDSIVRIRVEWSSVIAADLNNVGFEIADLPGNTLALTTSRQISLDSDAAGYGWFVDETPWQDEEFHNAVYDWELHSDVDSPAAGRIDLLTVLMHEMGHVLGLPDVPAGIDPTRLMTGILPPGIRRLPSEFDFICQPEGQESTEHEASPEYHSMPYDDYLAPIYESSSGGNSVNATQHQDTYDPEDLHIGITNGMFAIRDITDPGFGWAVHGACGVEHGRAVLGEGGRYFSSMSQTFIVPDGAQTLLFTIVSAELGTSERSPPDAFEVALLNADTMTSLVGIANGLTNTDAFMNIQPSGQTYFASQVVVPGLGVSGETLALTEPVTIEIDLTGVPAGTVATLYFDLLGFGEDDSQVIINNVLIIGEGPIPPIATDDTAKTGVGQAVEIDVLANDFDLDGTLDPTTVAVVADSGPEHGSVDVNPVTGAITYQPEPGYEGQDSFRYTVRDNEGYESNAAYVVVTVTLFTQQPTAVDDTYTVDEDTILTVEVPEGVLNNDNDPDGDPLSAMLISDVSHGTLTLNSDGSFDYIPAPNFNGSDSFTYVANDGVLDSNEATVTITVNVVNDAPVALPASLVTDEDTSISIDLQLLVSDVETAPEDLTFTVGNPVTGSVELLADGHTAVFSPTANYGGPAGFDYSVTDTGDNGDGAITVGPLTIDVTVNAIADAPILTAQDATGDEGTPIPLSISAALADTDGSESLGITIDGMPADATLSAGTDNGDGSWTLTPGDLTGLTITVADDASFDLTVTAIATEISDGSSASTTASIHMTVLNMAPSLVISGPDEVNEGSVYTLNLASSDAGNDTIISWTIDWGNGVVDSVSGNPISAEHVYAEGPANHTISAWATDEDGKYDANTVPVTVNNVAPIVATGSDQMVNEGQMVSLDPADFNDLGTLDTHTAEIDWGDGTSPEAGIVSESPFGPPGSTFGADGTVSGSHIYADNGTYMVTVTVFDDDSGVGSDTLIVTVNNIAPTVVAGSNQTVNESQMVSLDPATFNDLGTLDTHTATINWGDGTATEAGVVIETSSGPPGSTSGTDGTVDGSHVYADNGIYTVTVTVHDDDGALTSDTLTVTVLNVAPVADSGADQTANEGDVVNFSGSFTDPGSADTHTIEWDFGDSTTTAATLTPSHVYADNGIYTVTLTVTDDDGGVGVDTLTVTVLNVAPALDAGSDQTVDEGAVVSLDPATFNDKGTADTHTATIDWGDGTALDTGVVTETPFGPPGSTSGADGTVDGSHVYTDNGIYTVTLTVTDDDGASTSDTLAVTVNNVAPTVTADFTNQEVQYSDPIQKVSFSATDPSIDTMNAETSYSIDGGNTFLTGLPDALTIDAGLSYDGAGNQQTPATWTLSGIADLSPGTYIIRVTVTDDDGGEGLADTEIIVNPEDAISTYVGPVFVSTPSINDTMAIVQLRAVIQDISFYPEDPNWDPNAGNITTSTVTFINRDNGNTVIAAGLPVQLIDPADSTTGVAIYEWLVDLGKLDSESFTIEIIVEGHYSSPDEETVITVSKPLRNFITGGGYLINESSAGIYAGDPGLKTNFGFNVKFNKKLTNLQGKVNAIIRKDGRLYQIKTNATQSLVVDPINNTATFLSKANLKDITDPNNPIDLGGNLSVIVTLTDLGEPGTSDSISFTVWRKEALWFSSNWTGAQTIEQVLAGGNLVVHAESLALHAADGSVDEQTDGQLVTPELLEPIVEEAVLRWADNGIGSRHISALEDVEFRIADLAGSTIGLALGNTIWLDIDAAGYGWFVDSTPWDDAEFGRRNTEGEMVAKKTSEAYGDIDLLTVVMHEMGHTIGFEDLNSEAESKDLMYEMLQSGVRRTKTLSAARRPTTHSAVAWHYFGSRQKDHLLLNSWFSDWLRRYEELA